MRPSAAGRAMSALTVSTAWRRRPAAIWRIIRGMFIVAGQRLWHGAMQSPRCSLSSSSRAVRRWRRTSSVSLSTRMASTARVAQDGTSPLTPSTFTTQAMHDVFASQPSR